MLLPATISAVAPSTAIAFQIWMPSRWRGIDTSFTAPRSRQPLCRLAHHGVDIGLGIGPAKPFLNDPDPQAAGVSGELLGIRFRTQPRRLARVEAIGTGEHLEKPGGIAGGTGDGPGMIKC